MVVDVDTLQRRLHDITLAERRRSGLVDADRDRMLARIEGETVAA